MDSIKITALTDIGANIAYTTLVPVVNMSGTPTTQKANLQILGNLILSSAGGPNFVSAAQAINAQTVSNAAQPAITSVGTLTSLAVLGNVTSGNANLGNLVVANFFSGDGSLLTNISVSYSNNDVANYLPTYTGNVGANWLIADYVSGNALPLFNIPGSNVSGTVPYAAVANSVAVANVSGIGNIATINLNGNASSVLRGDGTWGADANSTYGNSNVVSLLGSFGSNSITTTGVITGDGYGLSNVPYANVTGTPTLGNISSINLTGSTSNVLYGNGVFAPVAAGAGGSNTQIQFNANGVLSGSSNLVWDSTYETLKTPRISIANAINSSASQIGITPGALPNGQGPTWTFDSTGGLYWPASGGALWVIEPNVDGEFEFKSTSNIVISTDISNSNSHFTFDTAGIFTAPSNVNLLGSRLNVGPDAANVANLLNPTLVIANSGASFIQAAIINNDETGSSDWAADGAGGSDDEAWTDMGFAGYAFSDANYTVTSPGDGYLFVQGYANGLGGNMVLATGDNSNTADIIFATGGFLANNEFARIDHANDVFHLTRAGSGIKFYDGTVQTTAGGGIGSELVNGNNSFVLNNDGNVVFEGNVAGQGVDRGLVWDFGANANGVNSMVRQDINGITVRAWTENGGGANGYSAPVNIITNQDANAKTWMFDGQGNLTVPSGSINSISDGGDLGAYITLTPDLGLARLAGRSLESTVNYTSTSWSNATYTGTQVEFTDAPDLVTFFTDNTFNVGVNQTFSINGDESVPFTGYTIGVGSNVIVYTNIAADPDPTAVTSIDFYYQSESSVAVDYDDGTLNVNATGLTINIDNDQTSGPDINIRSGDDILLQAKDKALGSESEGGDINILAGDGADDDGQGNTASTGGDIQITAGNGGDGNSGSGSAGGFTQIYGGTGGTAGVTNTAGPGGYVSINGGDGGYDTGNTQLGAGGGYVSIAAGASTQEGVNGPDVTITSGPGGPNALAGNVEIFTPASANGFGGTWRFDGNGKLTFPGTPRIDTYTNNFEIQAAENINFEANAVVNIYTDTGNAAYQWQFGDDGNLILAGGSSVIQSIANSSLDPTLPNVSTMTLTPDQNYNSQSLVLDPTAPGHIHLRAFASSNIDEPSANIFLGGENTAFEVTQGANNVAKIHSGSNTWTFGNDGRLTFPGTPRIDTSADNFEVQAAEAINFEANTVVNIYTDGSGNTYQWQFGDDGTLTAPGDITTAGDITGRAAANTLILKAQPTTNTYIQLNSIVDSTIQTHANLEIVTDSSNTSQSWKFDATGNLTLPGNTIAINFADNSPAFGNMVEWTTAPTANTDPGTAGQAAYDSGGNLYVCVASNTWAKFAGTTSW